MDKQRVFDPLAQIDLVKLADATGKVLKELALWWNLEPSAVLAPISELARSYVRAIDSSVLSAQQRYNISEDALQLSKSRKNKRTANHEEFAVSMLGLAVRAQDKASVSLEQFRNVRQALLKLIQSSQSSLDPQQSVEKVKLRELKKGIKVLDAMAKTLDQYIIWCNSMSMSMTAQVSATKRFKVDFSTIKEGAITKRWESTREGSVQYTLQISVLQDTYPNMFDESRGNSRKDQEMGAEDLSRSIEGLKQKRARVLSVSAELASGPFSSFRMKLRTPAARDGGYFPASGPSVSRRQTASGEVHFQPPQFPGINILVQSTKDALKEIVPWYRKEYDSQCLLKLQAQMRSYGFAIGLSISSARLVFTLAVEAQSLIRIMSKRTKAEELRPFLRGMVNHTAAGLETTKLVVARFRNVRKNVSLLCDHSNSGEGSALMSLYDIIDTLDAFRACISQFVNWWTQMNMIMGHQSASAEELVKTYTLLRKNNISEKWKELEDVFRTYTNEVGLLQDLYPDLIERIGDAGNVATDKLIKSTVDVLALTGSLYVNGLTADASPGVFEENLKVYGRTIGRSHACAQMTFDLVQKFRAITERLKDDASPEEIRPVVTQITKIGGLTRVQTADTVETFRRTSIASYPVDAPGDAHDNDDIISVEIYALKDSLSLYLKWWTYIEEFVSEQADRGDVGLQMPTVTKIREITAAWVQIGQAFEEYLKLGPCIQESHQEMFNQFFTIPDDSLNV